jgi:tRNA threonylcarbamoyladenosine biosynthesis protein TsaE
MRQVLGSEAALEALAACTARRWAAAGLAAPVVGLRGGLGAGKTTWVRATLRGLGYAGAVPSPTYTLLERYSLGRVELVHLDLYRISGDDELEVLGLRDWLGRCWVFIEWPQHSPALSAACDLFLEFDLGPGAGRTLSADAHTAMGESLLRLISDCGSSI